MPVLFVGSIEKIKSTELIAHNIATYIFQWYIRESKKYKYIKTKQNKNISYISYIGAYVDVVLFVLVPNINLSGIGKKITQKNWKKIIIELFSFYTDV